MSEIKKIEDIDVPVNVEFLSELFGVDSRTVQYYADASREERPLPKTSKGVYNLLTAIKWMFFRLKRKLEICENSGDETLHALKMESEITKNMRNQVALKRELAQLLDKKTTLIAWSNQISVIANHLNGLEFDLMRDLEDVTDTTEKQKIIKSSIEKLKDVVTNLEIESFVESEEKLEELLNEN